MKRYLVKMFVILSVILPQVSESIFGPCLLTVANEFNVTVSQIEQVYSYYLMGYAFGMLLWGWLADWYGVTYSYRAGLLVYLLGCSACVSAASVSFLMFSRVIQGFGASVCTVLAFVLCRLLFEGVDRLQMQANIAIALSIGPSLGPIIGEWVLGQGKWQIIYLPLSFYAIALLIFSALCAIQTQRQSPNFTLVASRILEPSLWLYATMIGLACGVGFSFYAEAPYLFMHGFGMSKLAFSRSFIAVGTSWYIGGVYARYLSTRLDVHTIIWRGIGCALLAVFLMAYTLYFYAGYPYACYIAWALALTAMAANSLVIGNTITTALSQYHSHIGTMTSLLGFLYYIVIAITTWGMSYYHDGTLYALPAFWFKLFMLIGLLHTLLHRAPNWVQCLVRREVIDN